MVPTVNKTDNEKCDIPFWNKPGNTPESMHVKRVHICNSGFLIKHGSV